MAGNLILTATIRLIDGFSSVLKNVLGGMAGFASGIFHNLANIKAGFEMLRGAVSTVAGELWKSVKEAFKFETLETQFSVLMGSMDKAKERMKELADFAASTPFQMEEVVNASRQLHVFSSGALGAVGSMTMIGDAAAAVGRPIDELAFWIGRAYSMIKGGQPFGEAAMRLQEMGIMTPDVRQKMESLQAAGAKQSAVWRVLQNRMLEFSGGMKTLSETGDGLTSTLQDNWTAAVRTFGQAFADTAKTGIQYMINLLGKLTSDGTITRWAERVKQVMYTIAGLSRALYEGGEQRAAAFSAIKDVLVGSFEIAATAAINLLSEYAPRLGLAIGKGIKDATSNFFTNENHEQYKQAAIEMGIVQEGSIKSKLHQGWWNIPDEKKPAFESRAYELIADKYARENKPAPLKESDRLSRGLKQMETFAETMKTMEADLKKEMTAATTETRDNTPEIAKILTDIDKGNMIAKKDKARDIAGSDTVQSDALQRIGISVGASTQMESIRDLTKEHIVVAKVMRDTLKKIESKDDAPKATYA